MTPQTKKILLWAFAGVTVIAGIILLVSLFGGRKNPDNKYFDMLIESKDREIKAEREHRITLEQWNRAKDQEIAELEKQDSVLKQKSQQVTIKYEKVPVIVRSYSYDELRSAVEAFGQ